MAIRFDDIGHRLKAFRLGSGLSAEEIAQKLGISRTALYRFEKGEVAKIETLEKLAELLQVSVPTLLGVGVEYIASAVSYFERMRQIEETAEHVIVLAGPISYVLASDAFDRALGDILRESVPEATESRERALAQIDELMMVLHQRKDTYRRRRPAVVNLIAAAEMERFLRNGLVGRHDLPEKLRRERRALARAEAEHFTALMENEPIGVQIGIVLDTLPHTSFQIFRPRRHGHDHVGARGARAARKDGAGALGERAQRPRRRAFHADDDREGGWVTTPSRIYRG
jgi:transcriptional regulator with XRE-family HTH domain